ncbi:MAG: hypothetical protein WC503_01205 [Candidatus Shapirobacteria bacterium]
MKTEEYKKIIEDLKKDYPIEDQIAFNEFDLQNKIEKNAFLFLQYQDLYYKEKSQLDYLSSLKDRLMCKLYDKFKFNDERNLNKQEIEKYYIPNDEKMIEIEKLIAKQKVRVGFFEIAAKALDKQSWSIKNYLDAGKLL